MKVSSLLGGGRCLLLGAERQGESRRRPLRHVNQYRQKEKKYQMIPFNVSYDSAPYSILLVLVFVEHFFFVEESPLFF